MKVALLRDERSEPKQFDITWERLCELLSASKPAPCTVVTCGAGEHAHPTAKGCWHKYGPAWSPVELIEDGKRGNANVRAVTAAVLDLDHCTDYELLLARMRLDAAGVEYVVHSTHSHRPPAAGAYRIVIRLTGPVPAEQWPAAWASINERFAAARNDPATKNLERIFFTPTAPSDVVPYAARQPGKPLAVASLLDGASTLQSAPPAAARPARAARTEAEGPVDLLALRKQVGRLLADKRASQRAEDAAHVYLLERLLEGRPFVDKTGTRMQAWPRLAGVLARSWHVPADTPVAALMALAQASLDATPRDPGDRAADCGDEHAVTGKCCYSGAFEHVLRKRLYDRASDEAQIEERRLIGAETGRALRTDSAGGDAKPSPPAERPIIVVDTDKRRIVDETEGALLAAGADVFVRSRSLVRVQRADGSVKEGAWFARSAGAPVITSLPIASLDELACAAATFQRFDTRKKVHVETVPPPWVAQTLAARGEWRFRALNGITDSPALRDDASIVEVPGYDERTRLIFAPLGVHFPPVPEAPTQEDAAAALAELVEPFADFNFVGNADRAVVIAAILSLLGRSLIDGCVPMFCFDAPTRGSGKSLLADAVSIVATGRDASRMMPAESDAEWRKRILSLALEGTPVVLVDNVVEPLGSASLDAALTGTSIQDRVLGHTATATADLRMVWLASGNNMTFVADTARRVLVCSIDPMVENPEDRQGFKHADLKGYLRAERPRLVVAGLTLLRAYLQAGRPAHGKSVKGSFEAWDRLVRGAILWAGGADPRGVEERTRAEADGARAPLRAFLLAWHAAFGAEPKTVAEAVAFAKASSTYVDPNETPAQAEQRGCALALSAALLEVSGAGRLDDTRALGTALKRLKGQVIGGLRLSAAGANRNGVVKWTASAV